MANLKILDDTTAVRLCRDDAFGITKTRKALADGREAYWSEHRYADAAFINAVDVAHNNDLNEACMRLDELALGRGKRLGAYIADFLSKIHPANEQARAAIIAAEARFLATWSEAA